MTNFPQWTFKKNTSRIYLLVRHAVKDYLSFNFVLDLGSSQIKTACLTKGHTVQVIFLCFEIFVASP